MQYENSVFCIAHASFSSVLPSLVFGMDDQVLRDVVPHQGHVKIVTSLKDVIDIFRAMYCVSIDMSNDIARLDSCPVSRRALKS